MTKIAILGGGSWGTALAIVLSRSRKAHEISLWMRDGALAESIRKARENELYLPGCRLPANVEITSNLARALGKPDIVVGAMPSAYARDVYTQALSFIAAGIRDGDKLAGEGAACVFVSATKGLEPS